MHRGRELGDRGQDVRMRGGFELFKGVRTGEDAPPMLAPAFVPA